MSTIMNQPVETTFPIGTRQFHPEPNMDYQLNRIASVCGGDPEVIARVAAGIHSIEDWIAVFWKLAQEAQAAGQVRQAAAYWRGVNFYLNPSDPRKLESYEIYVRLVQEMHRDDFANGRIATSLVPYGTGYLPVWHMAARPAKIANGTKAPSVVLHLGYDSYKEELLPILRLFSDAGLNIWLFEGPGQGEALYRYGLTMTHEWERPVKAVLDHLGLDDVTLIGLSLGGYLAPRAAAFEPRVKRVIAWGVLYDFYDVVSSRRGKKLERFLRTARFLRARGLLNRVVSRAMSRDSFTRWGVEQGMSVFGVASPWDYFETLGKYSLKPISQLVTQDFLLIGGTRDHFIPAGAFYTQAKALSGVRSLTARLFTAAEQAENHVQFGNIPLVARCMIDWIKERVDS